MNDQLAGALFLGSLVVALAVAHRPLGDYLARTLSSPRHLRAERAVYRLGGVDAEADQTWPVYLRSVLAFGVVSVLFLYAFLRLQNHVGHPFAVPQMSADQSWNTAVSFVTNTNWQSYSGESALGYVVQMAGPGGAELRLRRRRDRRGGRAGARLHPKPHRPARQLLGRPRAHLRAGAAAAVGRCSRSCSSPPARSRTSHDYTTIHTIAGGTQTITGGPVASQEAIKELGTNGGGFYNANSAHPFENPTAWTNWLEIFLLLVIPFSLPRTFGTLVGDRRQGRAIVAVMGLIALTSCVLMLVAQGMHHGAVPTAVGAADGGDRGALRGPGLRRVRHRDDADLDRRGEQLPRLVHQPRRRHDAAQHDAGRDRAGRHGLRSLRHADPGRARGVRRRADGRAHTRVPGQEARRPRGEVRLPLPADDAGARAGRHGHRDGAARRAGRDAQRGPARVVGGAVRVHLGRRTTTAARSPASR